MYTKDFEERIHSKLMGTLPHKQFEAVKTALKELL
jgi:hypothetical protein